MHLHADIMHVHFNFVLSCMSVMYPIVLICYSRTIWVGFNAGKEVGDNDECR